MAHASQPCKVSFEAASGAAPHSSTASTPRSPSLPGPAAHSCIPTRDCATGGRRNIEAPAWEGGKDQGFVA